MVCKQTREKEERERRERREKEKREKRERQRDRETERQRDRETERQRDRETCRPVLLLLLVACSADDCRDEFKPRDTRHGHRQTKAQTET